MSIICALLEDDGCWLGSDTLMTQGDMAVGTQHKVVWMSARLAIAWAGYDLIRNVLLSAPFDDMCDKPSLSARWMDTFIKTLRRELVEVAWTVPDRQGSPPMRDFSLLMTNGRDLMHVAGDLSYRPYPKGEFIASGSGMMEARGAAFALEQAKVGDALERVTLALKAAMALDRGCGGEVHTQWVARR